MVLVDVPGVWLPDGFGLLMVRCSGAGLLRRSRQEPVVVCSRRGA